MRNEFCLALLLLPILLILETSTTRVPTYSSDSSRRSTEIRGQHSAAKRKLSTQQQQQPTTSVDYDPKSRTALLDINLDQLERNVKGWRRRSVNNFNVEVLRWPLGSCPTIGHTCHSHHSTLEAATVVQHSKRICWTRHLNNLTGIECDENIPVDRKRVSVLLQHIYTGCYCFRLAFYHDDSIRMSRQLLERPIYLQSDVTEYDVFKWNLSLDLSASGQSDLSLFIKLDDEADAELFPSYHVELFRHDDIHADLMACHETDDPINNKHLTVTFEEDEDNSSTLPVIEYSLQEQWSLITFHNLSAGYYCVVVVPEDDRCHPPLIDPEKTCTRHSNIVQLLGYPNMVLTYRSHTSSMLVYWISCFVVVILLVSFVVIYVLLKRKMYPRLSLDDFVSSNVVSVEDKSLLRRDPSKEEEEVIPILFLYSSRSMSRLARHVSHLKEAIRNYVPNSLILDDADDEDLAVVEGVEWFSNHLQVAATSSNNNIRVVIFLCPEMLRCQERFLRTTSVKDNCHRDIQMDRHQENNDDDATDLDPVCCYRLNQLLHHIDARNVYRQVFAIRFDDLDIPAAGNQSSSSSSSSSSSFCLLTPYRSYHWPCDEIALLTELGRQGYSNGHRQDDDVCQSSSTK